VPGISSIMIPWSGSADTLVVAPKTYAELRDIGFVVSAYARNQRRIAIMWLQRVALDSDILPRGLENVENVTDQVSPAIGYDPLMERLVRALLPEEQACNMLQGFYADARHASIRASVEGWQGQLAAVRVGGFA
jgi:hypothetical protein